MIGFERLKNEYATCPDFRSIYTKVRSDNHRDYVDFLLRNGYLFRGYKLCIPPTSVRDFLVWELHAWGLARHFGRDKTIALVADRFYWPPLKKDVARNLELYFTAALVNLPKLGNKTLGCIHLCPYHTPWRDVSMDFV